MLTFIKDVNESTKFQIPVFDGAVIFQCRMLSPLEAEAAGLSSSLVASSMMTPQQIQKFIKQKDKLQNVNLKDPSDEDLQILLNMMDGFQPEQLLGIEEQQNKIICSVVKKASEDDGATFEDIHLVNAYEQESAEHNRLWSGRLSKEDRNVIIDRCMHAHKEAVESLRTFRKSG